MFIRSTKVILVHQQISYFPKNGVLEGNSKNLKAELYRVLLLFKNIDYRIRIAQHRDLQLNPTQNGGQLSCPVS